MLCALTCVPYLVRRRHRARGSAPSRLSPSPHRAEYGPASSRHADTAGTTTREIESSSAVFGSVEPFELFSVVSTCPHFCPRVCSGPRRSGLTCLSQHALVCGQSACEPLDTIIATNSMYCCSHRQAPSSPHGPQSPRAPDRGRRGRDAAGDPLANGRRELVDDGSHRCEWELAAACTVAHGLQLHTADARCSIAPVRTRSSSESRCRRRQWPPAGAVSGVGNTSSTGLDERLARAAR
jgi:hypothetical protein